MKNIIITFLDRLIKPLPENIVFGPDTISSDTPIGVYLHIPYCPTVCAYCAFSKKPDDPAERDLYVNALIKQLDSFSANHRRNPVEWVYFGGGTPSILTINQINRIMISLMKLNILPGTSITLEARLDTIDKTLIDSYKKAGINRLSVGVQTLNDHERTKLGLRLKADEVEKKLAMVSRSGIQFNVDLIFGTPVQERPGSWSLTLSRVLEYMPDQVTAYMYMPLSGTHTYMHYKKMSLYAKKKMSDTLFSLMEDAGYEYSDIFMFTKKKTTANTPYADISMVASDTMIAGFGQSAYSFFGKYAAVNPYDAFGFIRACESDKGMTFLTLSYNGPVRMLRRAAAFTTKISRSEKISGSWFLRLKVFLISYLWVCIYTMIRDWNTNSSLVEYNTCGAITRKAGGTPSRGLGVPPAF